MRGGRSSVSTTRSAISRYSGSRSVSRSRKVLPGLAVRSNGPITITGGAAYLLLDRRMQIDHPTTGMQRPTIVIAHHRATAGGQYHAVAAAQLGDHRLLAVTKAQLAFFIEDPWDIGTRAQFNFLVGIFEWQAQLFGQQTADGAFPAPIGPTRIKFRTESTTHSNRLVIHNTRSQEYQQLGFFIRHHIAPEKAAKDTAHRPKMALYLPLCFGYWRKHRQ